MWKLFIVVLNRIWIEKESKMQNYIYHLVNVFAESHFGGNPLCVFPKADGLTDDIMQAIAKQFNLSETVFIFAPTDKHGIKAVADLRIFTPEYELPLAGHPTLGSGFILYNLLNLKDNFTINTVSKFVDMAINQNLIELTLSGFDKKLSSATHDDLAKLTGLSKDKIDNQAIWLNSGSAQLLLQVFDKQALFDAKIDKDLLQNICQHDGGRDVIYLWCEVGESVFSRFFYIKDGAVVQDSGTGSACANLGAYFILKNQYPTAKTIHQGDDMGQSNRLTLKVNNEQNIYISM